jgi:hypothetical protein
VGGGCRAGNHAELLLLLLLLIMMMMMAAACAGEIVPHAECTEYKLNFFG